MKTVLLLALLGLLTMQVSSQVYEGYSAIFSQDGSTMAIGSNADNAGIGAVWIFTKSPSGSWSQQGSKLVGTGYDVSSDGFVEQGASVALSADGSTLAVGGIQDGNGLGAVWIFTSSGGAWTQQGSKLVGTGYTANGDGLVMQGYSVSLSANGNTLAVGGPFDSSIGSVWIFSRSGTTWSQVTKLVGTGYVVPSSGVSPALGASVSLSADGNTLAIGAPYDNLIGALWIFTQSNGAWSQVGSKLVPSDVASSSETGTNVGESLSLSPDATYLVVGGPSDNSGVGATWVYTNTGGTWSQQGSKIVPLVSISGSNGVQFGAAVSISTDGKNFVSAGLGDSNIGAVWVYTPSNGTWIQGPKLIPSNYVGPNPIVGASVAITADGTSFVVTATGDSNGIGAFWVYTSVDGTWIQGPKLVGSGYNFINLSSSSCIQPSLLSSVFVMFLGYLLVSNSF